MLKTASEPNKCAVSGGQDARVIARIIELLKERDESMKIVLNISGGNHRRIKIEVTRYIEVAE